MTVALTENQLPPASPTVPRRKKWTREEVAFFEGAELFAGSHYELIEGELIDKMGKLAPHSTCVHLMMKALISVFGLDFVYQERTVNVFPFDNPTSAPEPDIVVLRRGFRHFAQTFPDAADIALLVEVADTTLSFDLRTKADLYARAGIEDYWVADVNGRSLIVHREPIDGEYRSVIRYSESESVAPLAAPDTRFDVSAAFPPLR
jgi:Uma2 family endonuclease